MTLPEALTRLAAAGRIRSAWLPGMLSRNGFRVIAAMPGILSASMTNSGEVYLWAGDRCRLCSPDTGVTWGAPVGTRAPPDSPADDDPATTGCLLALLREAVGSPYLSPTWNAYLGRRHDPSDPGPDDFDNPPVDTSLDNARQWRIDLCGAPDEVYDRLGTDLLGEGATDYDAVVAALDFVAGRLA